MSGAERILEAPYGSPVYGAWRQEAAGDWQAYTHHAFVEQLGAGTLPREIFLHYLTQDYIFLFHFARAWALAVVKSETIAEAPNSHTGRYLGPILACSHAPAN